MCLLMASVKPSKFLEFFGAIAALMSTMACSILSTALVIPNNFFEQAIEESRNVVPPPAVDDDHLFAFSDVRCHKRSWLLCLLTWVFCLDFQRCPSLLAYAATITTWLLPLWRPIAVPFHSTGWTQRRLHLRPRWYHLQEVKCFGEGSL
jgi:hypothetical protein